MQQITKTKPQIKTQTNQIVKSIKPYPNSYVAGGR
jgi:hypothetical protein